MTASEQIEVEIHELLSLENHTVTLNNKLFGPNGLFSRLASTEEERRIMGRSPLFKEAQRRLRKLEKRDATALKLHRATSD